MSHAPSNTPERSPQPSPEAIEARTKDALGALGESVLTRTLARAEYDREVIGGLAAQVEAANPAAAKTPYARLAALNEEQLLERARGNADA